MREWQSVKMTRSIENLIMILASVLEEEKSSGIYYTDKEMFERVMILSKGKVNPVFVQNYIDNIMKERY